MKRQVRIGIAAIVAGTVAVWLRRQREVSRLEALEAIVKAEPMVPAPKRSLPAVPQEPTAAERVRARRIREEESNFSRTAFVFAPKRRATIVRKKQ